LDVVALPKSGVVVVVVVLRFDSACAAVCFANQFVDVLFSSVYRCYFSYDHNVKIMMIIISVILYSFCIVVECVFCLYGFSVHTAQTA